MTAKCYDLVAIGGGTAGLVSAAGGAYLGVDTAIVERAALGGDCLWTGCVPSKALIASARLAHAMRHADRLGLEAHAPKHAFAAIMERMRGARGVVAHHDDPERFRAMGVDVHFGAARFESHDTLDVEGVGRLRAKRFVVATGARPAAPPIRGLAEAGYLDHHRALEIDELPRRIAVIGAGPVGMEMAQVFARLGASVVVFEVLDRVLPAEDRDVAERLQAMMEREGIGFRLGAAPTAIDGDGPVKVVVTESGERIAVDEIFVATGRAPATGGLALERAGISTRDGAVEVDSTLRTSNRRVWAAGDVIGGMQYTHVAEYHAKTVLRNALLPGAQRVDYTTVPRVTYTDPELAHVGLSEAEAGAAGGTTYSYELDDLDRAIVDAEARGVVKISADGRGRILGATILGSHAGELLMPLVIAKRHGLKLGRVAGTIFPYPTMAEGVKRASDAYMRSRLESPGGRVLRRVISWLK